METWMKINDDYEISESGTVRSVDRYITACSKNGKKFKKFKRGVTLKPCDNGKGYLSVNLHIDGKTQKQYIHRLVACAFIDNPNNFNEINHKDENKSNNSVSNLEWCDHLYNINYGNCIEKNKKNNSKKPICQYTLNGELVKVWESQKEAGRNGFCRRVINKVLKNGKPYKGFIWKYYE